MAFEWAQAQKPKAKTKLLLWAKKSFQWKFDFTRGNSQYQLAITMKTGKQALHPAPKGSSPACQPHKNVLSILSGQAQQTPARRLRRQGWRWRRRRRRQWRWAESVLALPVFDMTKNEGTKTCDGACRRCASFPNETSDFWLCFAICACVCPGVCVCALWKWGSHKDQTRLDQQCCQQQQLQKHCRCCSRSWVASSAQPQSRLKGNSAYECDHQRWFGLRSASQHVGWDCY